MSKVKNVLIKARDLIENGWVRGHYSQRMNGVQCYCAVGAIREVTRNVGLRIAAVEKLAEVVNPAWKGMSTAAVTIWNDNVPGRDKRYVIRGFNKAIATADGINTH